MKNAKKPLTDEQIDIINKKMIALNKEIDTCLSKDFEIGHSYFVDKIDPDDFNNSYNDVIEYQIIPALEEYLYDDETKLKEMVDLIK